MIKKNLRKNIAITSLIWMLIIPSLASAGVFELTLLEDDFESGDPSSWSGYVTTSGETVSIEASAAYEGTYGARFTTDFSSSFEGAYLYKEGFASSELYVRGRVRVTQSGIADDDDRFYFIRIRADTQDIAFAGWKRISGVLLWTVYAWIGGTGYMNYYSAVSPAVDTWYDIELHWVEGTTNGLAELYVDGVPVVTSGPINSDDAGSATEVRLGLTQVVNCDPTEAHADNIVVRSIDEQYTLSTYTTGKGTIIVDPIGPYDPDTIVNVEAVPDSGWAFSQWTDDLTGSTNPTTITITADKTITAVFTDIESVTVSTSASSYNLGETMTIRIRQGTPNGQVMIQIDLGSNHVWADQKTLDSLGQLDYSLKFPSTWAQGTYTIRIKDGEGGTTATASFAIPKPTPPSGGGGPGGGGGVVLPSVILIRALSPLEAAKILEKFGPVDVGAILQQVNNDEHVVNIIEYFTPAYSASVIGKMNPEFAGRILNMMDTAKSANIIAQFDGTNKAALQAMINENLENAATVVEEAVKIKVADLSEEERKVALSKLADALEALEAESLIELLVSIAKLPETPSTVAYILEPMDRTTVLQVVSEWIGNENYIEARIDLAHVFSYLSTDLLGAIYDGISNQARTAIYPLLDQITISMLPEITTYQVTNLVVSPTEVNPGDDVTINYMLTNTGDKLDDYATSITVNGAVEKTYTGLLANGTMIQITYTLTRSTPGIYTVGVADLSSSFNVVEAETPPPELEPADLRVTGIQLVPKEVIEGTEYSIFVTIKNQGEETGTKTYTLKIDAQEIDTREVTLIGGESSTLVFNILADYTVGAHEISIDGSSSTLMILAKASEIPWFTIITVAIIIVAVIGLYIYTKKRTS